MFSCFFQGFSSFLLRSIASARERRLQQRDLSGLRLTTVQSRKLGKVAVVGDPITGVLDGERRIPSVRNPRSSNLGLAAQPLENRPMPLTGLDNLAMRLNEKIVAKTERLLQRTGLDEGARVGRYPCDSAQRQR